MRDSIIEKLRAVLAEGLNSECKVLYVLAESRKLLDKYHSGETPFALKLHCHWALHIDLTRSGTTKSFLDRVETYADGVLAGSVNVLEEHRMNREFIFMDTFREQFAQFLKYYDLPAEVCEQESRWHEFLKHYAGIIDDGSLSCKKEAPLKRVSEVVFRKGRARTSDSYFAFDFAWDIVLVDGRTMTVEVGAEPLEEGQLLSNKISLR